MSHVHSTPDCNLVRWGAAAAILLGLSITALNLIHVNAYMLLMGPTLVLAGILSLRSRRNGEDAAHEISPGVTRSTSLLLQACFWLLLAWAAVMAHGAATERPLAFFIVVAVCWALLAVRTLEELTPRNIASILVSGILLSLVLRGSVFFLTPGFPGSDAWAHDQLTQAVLTGGHIPTAWSSPYYLHYPALHLTVAATALITGASTKVALFAGIGVPLSLSAVAVFVIARRLTDSRIALLAALLVLFASYHLQWGTQIIPTSLGLTLYTLCLMLCLRSEQPRKADALLLLIAIVAIVLSHTVSSFILWTTLLTILTVSSGCLLMLRASVIQSIPRATVVMLLLLTVVMFLHWSMCPYTQSGESFLEWMLTTARESICADAGFLERPWDVPTPGSLTAEIAAISGFVAFYFLTALGALSSHRCDRTHAGLVVIAVMVGLLSAFVFAFPLFGIRTILPHRWFAFIWIPAAVIAAIGLHRWCGAVRPIGSLMLFAMTGLFALLMISAPVSNTDSPKYATELTQRLCFYESELCAAVWLAAVGDGRITSDLQFGSRVLGDTFQLSHVRSSLQGDARASEYHVWRNTSFTQPIQTGEGTETIPGVREVLDIERNHCAVHATRSCTVFVIAGADHGRRAEEGD